MYCFELRSQNEANRGTILLKGGLKERQVATWYLSYLNHTGLQNLARWNCGTCDVVSKLKMFNRSTLVRICKVLHIRETSCRQENSSLEIWFYGCDHIYIIYERQRKKAFSHFPSLLSFCINACTYTSLANVTQKSINMHTPMQLRHMEILIPSEPLQVSLGSVWTAEPVGWTSNSYAFTRNMEVFWSAVGWSAWLTRLVVCILAKAWGALSNTWATDLPRDLNKCVWNHSFLVSLLNELKGDGTVALLDSGAGKESQIIERE